MSKRIYGVILFVTIVITSGIIYNYLSYKKNNDIERIFLDKSFFSDDPEELNERYINYITKEHENYISAIKGVKEVRVLIDSKNDEVKSVDVEIEFDDNILAPSEQEKLKTIIEQYLKTSHEDAEIKINTD